MVRALVTLASMASLATVALANISFNVVGYPNPASAKFGVVIDGKLTEMKTNDTTFPLWSVFVPGANNGTQYHYVMLSSTGQELKKENFVRTANVTAKRMATEHEFFERPITKHPIVPLPYVYPNTWPTNSKAFKENQIATLHLLGPKAEIDRLNADPTSGTETKVTVRYINAKTIYTQHNISFKTGGKSSKGFDKQSYKLEFEDKFGQEFFDRPNIKLRALGTTEPSMIRERLYIDMLNAVGIPTQQGTYVRLFVNNVPYGLYLMVDDIKKSFLKQTVHEGADLQRGTLVQMNAWEIKADLTFRGANTANYYVKNDHYVPQHVGINVPPTEPLQELIAFISDLQAFNPTTTPNPVQYFNETRLDLDGFLRCMALEYLFGAFDNYWQAASNYFMYRNPTLAPGGGKWQWIPTDFDGVIGVGSDYVPNEVYTAWWTPSLYQGVMQQRPLVEKLILQNTAIKALFEETLKNIVSYAWKPTAMDPHVEALYAMLKLDVEWDLSLPRQSPGQNRNFTFQDHVANLGAAVSGKMNQGIKPWIAGRANAVATAQGFTIPPEVVNRVTPKPKPKKGDDDVEDDAAAGGPNGAGGRTGSAPTLKQASGLVTVLAVVASAVLLA
ncbi:hypothetical protein DFQ26_002517 [Actinomortierella ambigua]|nr:hypothetical protein DFQ26_002517 [Actinomortierella ambigua]